MNIENVLQVSSVTRVATLFTLGSMRPEGFTELKSGKVQDSSWTKTQDTPYFYQHYLGRKGKKAGGVVGSQVTEPVS